MITRDGVAWDEIVAWSLSMHFTSHDEHIVDSSCLSHFFFALPFASVYYIMTGTQNEKLKRSSTTISYKGPKVDGDGDVWIERRVKIKGVEKSYFRSVLTDECCWNEPPNGASYTVFQDELELYPFLKDFALKPWKPLTTIQLTTSRKK